MMPVGILALAAVAGASAAGPDIAPGDWAVTSTVVDLTVPGVPRFLQRLARGKSKSERKRLAPGQGIEALLAPDPKAQCRVDSQQVTAGRYHQALTCPQKRGDPVHIDRAGSYDSNGFAGRATVMGETPKGPVNIVLDQRAKRIGA